MPVLGPTQPPIQWLPGVLSPALKRPWLEADHSPPSSAEVKKAWSYTSTPPYDFIMQLLVKPRDNFNVTLPHLVAHSGDRTWASWSTTRTGLILMRSNSPISCSVYQLHGVLSVCNSAQPSWAVITQLSSFADVTHFKFSSDCFTLRHVHVSNNVLCICF
jgi:hypothetical protein